jgi:eukaryotic-like serine/threonine-protein kinase
MDKRKDRTRALTRHSRFQIGDLQVHPDRLIVLREGLDIPLEPREMEVLIALAEKTGDVVNTDELLIKVWQGDFYGDNPVNKTISGLRKSIGDDSRAPRYIETLRGRGYRLIAPVSFPNDYRRAPKTSDTWTRGSPFVGLAAFDAEHAPVFSGRSRMTAELLGAMRTQIDHERRFVLLVGASGCGKTSLLRAGALPLLTQSGGFGGLRALAVATCDLAAAHAGDVMTPLAAALSTWMLGDRPVFPPQTADDLKALLIKTPESIDRIIDEAFRRHPEHGLDAQPHAHLLLSIDHAEVLVSTDRDPVVLATFERALCALCDTPRALVTMITRSDYYPKLAQALPTLTERKTGGGHLDVLTPKYGEIADIIRNPAWQAGLKFDIDKDTQQRLDDTLRDTAIGQPDALPLLQHTLQTLYERRTDDGTLTCTAYREIGGLEGAIAHRAEEVFTALPADVQATLDTVLAKLVVVQLDSNAITARRSRLDVLTSDVRILVDAFVRGRLFVSELHDGHPSFGVTHEALLRQWPRAVEWVEDNRRLLRAKSRLKRAATRWAEEHQGQDFLLNSGRPLDEAMEAAKRLPFDLEQSDRDFLRASKRLFLRKRMLYRSAVFFLAIAAVFASTMALVTARAKETAESALASLVKQSDAFRNVSELVFRNANMISAEASFITTAEELRKAHKNNPESEEILFQYAIYSYWLGYLYLQDGRLPEARTQWVSYLQSTKTLTESSPENKSWKKELSYAYNNIGNLDLKERKISSALVNFRYSLAIKKSLISPNETDTALIVDYADTLSWISSTEESLADLSSASSGYREQISLLKKITSTPSADRNHRRQLANALWRASRLSAALGSHETAETQILEGIALLEHLANDASAEDIFRKDLAYSLLEASNIHRALGKNTLAVREIEASKHEVESIQMDDQSPHAWLRLRETIRFECALHSSSADRDVQMERAIFNLEQLHEAHPQQPQIAIDIANARISRGILNSTRNRGAESIEDWREARERIRSFAAGSKDHTVVRPWIVANELLGDGSRVLAQKQLLAAAGYRQWQQ